MDDKDGSWHAVYSSGLRTWFFTSTDGKSIALERTPIANPELPAKAPPGFEPKPWRWRRRPLPTMAVTATDELARGTNGVTLFRRPTGGFDDLLPATPPASGEIEVSREKIWAWLDRARERGLRVNVSVDNPSRPDAHAVLVFLPPVK